MTTNRRTAIITGASRGLGFAISARLVEDGWKLVIDARTLDELEQARVALDQGESTIVALPGDVANQDHAEDLVTAAVGLGDFELLINNASVLGPSPQPKLADYPLETLEELYRTNIVAPLRLIQLALPALRETTGRIINVTSDAAIEGYPGWGGYGSSKAALEQLSRVIAAEEPDVRIFWVDPGDMNTRMHQAAFPGEDISDRADPATRVPGFIRLIDDEFPSGRYAVDSLLIGTLEAA